MTVTRNSLEESASIRFCEEVARTRARNFWYGIRLLPPPKRHALAAVYAMSRRIDDAGDGDLPLREKRAVLDRIEASLSEIRPDSEDPVLATLGRAGAIFPIPMEAFRDLVDGVRMDVDGTEYRTFDDLLPYCRRVAGAVGRLSLGVFGSARMDEAEPLADDLGVAMQLTNILRDVREDLARGRVYVPGEDLERFGCSPRDLVAPMSNGTAALIRFEADRARQWFRRGLPLLSMLDRRSAACAGAMAGIYSRLLGRIEQQPQRALDGRVTLSAGQKAWVAARALAGAVG
jgi:15-cis-phytoene synthase